jgi:hypothetical protein
MVPKPAQIDEKGNPTSYVFARHVSEARTVVNTSSGNWARQLHLEAGGSKVPDTTCDIRFVL